MVPMPSAIAGQIPSLAVAAARQDPQAQAEPLQRLQDALESCPLVADPHQAVQELLACCENRGLHLEAFAETALLTKLPLEAWQALDELCGGIMTLGIPYADGLLDNVLPALSSLTHLNLVASTDIRLTGVEKFPAWQEGRRPHIDLTCTSDGLHVTVPSGTPVTALYLADGQPVRPSIVTFVCPDGSLAEPAQLLAGMEGDASRTLQLEIARALGLSTEDKDGHIRTSELAEQLSRIGLQDGEFDVRRLYRDDRSVVFSLSAQGWQALRAISLGQGRDIHTFDCGAPGWGSGLRGVFMALKGLTCVVVDKQGFVDVSSLQDDLALPNMPGHPVLSIRRTGDIHEIRARSDWLHFQEGAEEPNAGMPLLVVNGQSEGGIPDIPFASNPLDAKGQPLRHGDPGFDRAAAAADRSLNGDAFFKDPVSGRDLAPIVCRHLAVAWCRLRAAHLSGENRHLPFSYAPFKDEKAITSNVGADTELFDKEPDPSRSRICSRDELAGAIRYLGAGLARGTHEHYQLGAGTHALGLEIRHQEDGRRSVTVYDPNRTGRDFTCMLDADALQDFLQNIVDPYLSKHYMDFVNIKPMEAPSRAFAAMGERFVTEAARSSPFWWLFAHFGNPRPFKCPVTNGVLSNESEHVRAEFARFVDRKAAAPDRADELVSSMTIGLALGASRGVGALADTLLAADADKLERDARQAALELEAANVKSAHVTAKRAPDLIAAQRRAFHEWGLRFARMRAADPSVAAGAARSVAAVRQGVGSTGAVGYAAALYCGALASVPPDPGRKEDALQSLFPRGADECAPMIEQLAKGKVGGDDQHWALSLANALSRALPDFRVPLTPQVRDLFARAYPPGRVEPSGDELATHRDASLGRLLITEVVFPSAEEREKPASIRCESRQPIPAFEKYLLASEPTGACTYLLPPHLLEPAPLFR